MQCTSFKFYPIAWAIILLLISQTVLAINNQAGQKATTLLEIQQKIQAIKTKQNITDELKNRLLSIYAESAENLNELQAQESQAESFKLSMSSMPVEAKRLQRQILEAEESLKNRKLEKLSIFPTDEIEQRLIIEKTHLSDLDAEINRLESQIADQLNRPQLIREKMAEIKSRHQEQQILANKTSENSLEKEAKQLQLETRIRMLNSTLKTLERESISDPLRLQIQKDQMHLLNIQREMQFQLVSELDTALLERRQQSIDKEQAQLLE
ncbi:MAG: mechanosensitive ion channel protein MscS, partial [Methylococcaceae bacterium]|nr:mechanosensitive ion channel protein MscS [Methylococcaceae bacterium]